MVDRVIKPAAKRCIGNTYGKLKVIGVSWEKGKGHYFGNYVECICSCGNKKIVRADSIERGDTTSCGCNYSTPRGVKFPVMKTSDHPMYGIFCSMQQRCKNKNTEDYKYYGERGISLCDRWDTSVTLEAFDNFLKDMECSYEKGLEIERINVNGNYEKSNCTWVCRRSQVNNLRCSRVLTGFGVHLTLAEWGELLQFNPKMLGDRINKLKWIGDLPEILKVCFKDRQHTLEYKGEICSASKIFSLEGFTAGQRNARINTHGDSVSALKAEGVDFKVVKPRDKNHLSFEEGLLRLKGKDKDSFEEHLLYKIEKQLGELNE